MFYYFVYQLTASLIRKIKDHVSMGNVIQSTLVNLKAILEAKIKVNELKFSVIYD